MLFVVDPNITECNRMYWWGAVLLLRNSIMVKDMAGYHKDVTESAQVIMTYRLMPRGGKNARTSVDIVTKGFCSISCDLNIIFR